MEKSREERMLGKGRRRVGELTGFGLRDHQSCMIAKTEEDPQEGNCIVPSAMDNDTMHGKVAMPVDVHEANACRTCLPCLRAESRE